MVYPGVKNGRGYLLPGRCRGYLLPVISCNQQAGATPHTGHGVAHTINQPIHQGGWNCALVNPPAQSPDLNLLDLGLFRRMKSNADGIKGNGRNIETCIQRMDLSFKDYS